MGKEWRKGFPGRIGARSGEPTREGSTRAMGICVEPPGARQRNYKYFMRWRPKSAMGGSEVGQEGGSDD